MSEFTVDRLVLENREDTVTVVNPTEGKDETYVLQFWIYSVGDSRMTH